MNAVNQSVDHGDHQLKYNKSEMIQEFRIELELAAEPPNLLPPPVCVRVEREGLERHSKVWGQSGQNQERLTGCQNRGGWKTQNDPAYYGTNNQMYGSKIRGDRQGGGIGNAAGYTVPPPRGGL